MKRKSREIGNREKAVTWLPVDSRLMYPLFSFGHVKGVAKFFLTIEMVLAMGVVLGSVLMMALHFLS